MTGTSPRLSVRIDRRHLTLIKDVARKQNVSPSQVVRWAIDAYLAGAHDNGSSRRRLARLAEFQNLALDVIILEQYPELRERMIAETDKRLEQYHGA
ncbi:hypothetical protein [Sphingobium sp.]|uniref:hypothetical protein n=1 Tax=Sphingobium sp. TaxID=1912891 RepID=UPI0028BD620E|nr:hypothetical protein [Sphingobium sp.]